MIGRISLVALLVGCAPDEKFNVETGELVDGLRTSESTTTSDSGGRISLNVPFTETDSSVLFTLTSNALLALEQVYDPDGTVIFDEADWYSADQFLTDAVYDDSNDVVFNWPIRDSDEQLSVGDWEFIFATIDEEGRYQEGYEATVHTQIKEDDDLSSGTLSLTLGLTPDTEADLDVLEAVQASVACWKDMWGELGLELNVEWISVDMDSSLPYPIASTEIEAIASEGTERDILLLVGETVANEAGLYGIAGSIPGSLLATERSGIVISWLENSGSDGVFNAEEVQLMCETMAHETGHYLGLYHPVGSDYLVWDALEDTPACDDEWTCEDEMSDNLMFPYPVCSSAGCENQTVLSSDQQSVIQRYTGTL